MPIRKIETDGRGHPHGNGVEFLDEPDVLDSDDGTDDDADGYGPNPLTPVHNALRARPASVAVAIEVLVVLVLGNQWMFDHVIARDAFSEDPIHAGLANGLAFFSWPVSGAGSGWFVVSAIVRALVWFAVTFLLARLALRVADRPARIVAVTGGVVLAAIVAVFLARVFAYFGLAAVYRHRGDEDVLYTSRRPSFAQTLFFGQVPGGSVLFVALVALLAAAGVEWALRPVGRPRSRTA